MAACGEKPVNIAEEKKHENDEEKLEVGNWLALESNPELLNNFAARMGMPENFSWNDVWGFDDEMLAMVPKPVIACVLLFPTCKEIDSYKSKQAEAIDKDGQILDDLFYMTQYVGNACGTVALCHALANSCSIGPAKGPINLSKKGPLHRFIVDNLKLSPSARGRNLVKAKSIQEQSDNAASSSVAQTATPDRYDKVGAHFAAFVNVNESLYELDGRKKFPINHGKTTAESFLKDTATVVKQKFMKLVPNNPAFNLMALSMTKKYEKEC